MTPDEPFEKKNTPIPTWKSNHSLWCPCQTLVGVTCPDIDSSKSRNRKWKIEVVNDMVFQ